MALRGTLNDFGIANVFQIIGQQQKIGILTVINRDEQVKFHFDQGNVVRCEASRRQKAELIGNMLVRAEAITEQQLMDALGKQKGSGKRIGDVLIEQRLISAGDLAAFARLQTSETVFRVFLWRAGTYEFAAMDVSPEAWHAPLRAESLLMEGFRQVDEWPNIRSKLNSYAITFTVEANLDEALMAAEIEKPAGDDMDFDFGDGGGKPSGDPRLKNIEHRERLVYSLVQPKRDIQKIIDLSRLGEFETCQALVNLMDAGFVAAHAPPASAAKPSAEATVGGISAGRPQLRLSSSSFTYVAWVLGAMVAFVLTLGSGLSVSATARRAGFVEMQLEDELARGEMQQIRQALDVYLAAYGAYPDSLDGLVQAGLLPTHALSFPWRQPYIYNRTQHAYTLLRPLF